MPPQWEPLPYLTSEPDTWRELFFEVKTARDVAALLEVDYRHLVWMVYGNRDSYYDDFSIPKRRGGERQISAPRGSLKLLQGKLASILGAVYLRKPPVHGFVRDRSILTNARSHSRSQFVLNIDLVDFFPSIHFGRVRGLFSKKPYYRPSDAATALAAICCYQDALPQGAATSPVTANMICGQLDSQLLRLAAAHDCTYTRIR
jgi:RNA-directed DNA polymerase